MTPTPDPRVIDALRTVDRFGDLMPSHVGTEQADMMEAAGLIAYTNPDCPFWPRLTEAGWAARKDVA